jgi:hypothetical protein
MKFIGRLADVGIAKEASRGTAESAASFWIKKLSLTLDDGVEQVIDESSVGVIEDAADAKVVGKYATGEIEGNIGDKSFGLILLSALGAVNTTGPSQTTVYTHAFSVAQSAQHPALTLFLDDPNQDYKYPLAVLDSLEIDASVGAFAKFMASFRSKVGETATLTPSYAAENTFLPQHITLKYADDEDDLGTGTAVDVRSLKLTISKNIEDDRKLGSIDQVDILNKQFSVEGTVEMVFDANTFKTFMLGDTAKAVRLELTNSDVTIGSSLNPKLTIDMAKVKFSSFEKTYGNNETVVATVNFKAFYSTTESEMITVDLVNEQSAY